LVHAALRSCWSVLAVGLPTVGAINVDMPGACMQTDIDEVIHMKLKGLLAKSLTKVNPEKHSKYVEHEKGKPTMHIRLKKALCGALQAALLFWIDLSSNLERWGFTLEPCDWCVPNKMINGKQCATTWHADGIKLYHTWIRKWSRACWKATT
jgi:hypothetical protein